MAYDNADTAENSYYDDTNHNLKFAIWNGAGWSIEVVPGTTGMGKFSSLAVSPIDNSRHLAYYDLTNSELKYSYWNGGWSLPAVVDANPGDKGYYASIALNGLGEPAISYYDNSLGALKLAYKFSGALPPGWLRFFVPFFAW